MLPPFDPWRSGLAAAEVMSASRADAATLEALRARRLHALLAGAARDSPLYRRLLEGLPLDGGLQLLPIVHKRELMQAFDDWVTDPRVRLAALRRFTADRRCLGEPFLGRYTVWESSGSSGEPGVFIQDAAALAVYDALEALRRPSPRPWQRLLDPCYLAERIAFVGATGGHFAGTVSTTRLRRLNPALAGALHELSFLQPLGELVDELHALGPSILSTYPSAAVMLAHEQRAGRLRLALHEVWTGGETLSASMRRFVAESFACPVVDSYGSSEFLSLASECRLGRLHLNSDWAVLEPVDAQGRAVPAGATGATTLLTNLANHVQPLIRYDMGDRVRLLPQRCDCGSHLPVIEVQGRSDDTLHLPGPDGAVVGVLPLALTTVLEDEAGLFDFQLEQGRDGTLLLHTPMAGGDAAVLLRRAHQALARFLAQQGAPGVRIRCRPGVPHHRGAGGKVKRVIATSGGASGGTPD
ncbi:MAG: phenylacetate--CoA ligase family protein [Rhizobacter sp.]|nr:phenylacetate--CoA ligase family protein [Rhizobacter sp.]